MSDTDFQIVFEKQGERNHETWVTKRCKNCGGLMIKNILSIWVHVSYSQMLKCTSQKSH